MSPAQVAAANGAEDAQREKGLWSPWCGGQGRAGSGEMVLFLCHDCPAHRHWAPASFTFTQLGLPCTSGSVLTGWTFLSSLATMTLKDMGKDSADQRPNASHCLAPQNILDTGSGPCCPLSLQGQASPAGPSTPAEAAWGLWLCGWGHLWWR